MATVLETSIQNPKYINHLKTGLGLQQLQKGLSPSIDRILKSVHSSLKARTGGLGCRSCTIETVLLHSQCANKNCICSKNAPKRRPCPTRTCDFMYNEIVKLHQRKQPQFYYTELWEIYEDHWVFGKCFLPPGGYGNVQSASKCDTTGLLSIVINCKEVAHMVGVDIHIKTRRDVFHEVKDIRNGLMHAPVSEMETCDMEASLDKMIQLLQCRHLQTDAYAKDAARNILQLKDSRFTVTKEMEKGLLEEMKSDIAQVKTDVAVMITDVAGVKTDVAGMITGVTDVKTDVSHVKADVTDVKTDVSHVKADVTDVKTDVSHVKADVTDVKTDVSNVKADVTDVKSDVSHVKADVTEVKSDVSNVKADVTDVKSDVSNVKADVTVVKSDVSNVKADVTVVKTDVSQVKADVMEIKSGLAEARSKEAMDSLDRPQVRKRVRSCEIKRKWKPLKGEQESRRNEHLKKLKNLTEIKLKRHSNKENPDFESRLTSDLVAKLNEKRKLALTGQSGIGKTHQSLNVLSIIQKAGKYMPVIVKDVSEIEKILPCDEPVCILIDAIGKFTANADDSKAWRKFNDTWLSLVEDEQLMIIITINSVQWNDDSNYQIRKQFQSSCIDLDINGMTPEEKRRLVQKYGINPDAEPGNVLLNDETLPLGLPLLCTLAKDKTTDIAIVMKESLKEHIKQMDRPYYIALLMVLFTGKQFSDSILDTDEGHVSTCFKKLTGAYKSEDISKFEVLSAASSLDGSYLEKTDDGTYRFIHGLVLEATFSAAIDRHTKYLLIKYCHLPIVLKLSSLFRHGMTDDMKAILLHRFQKHSATVKEVGTSVFWLEKDFQKRALDHFKKNVDFFTKSDENDESMITIFASLGLTWLVTSLLQRLPNCQRVVEVALLKACSHGQLICVRALLEEHCTRVKDEHVFQCLQSGNEELFNYLLNKGGNIQARHEKDGRNLIHEASTHNRLNLVQSIVSKLGDAKSKFLNMRTSVTQETPLCIAVQKCDVQIVRFLIGSGSDPRVRDWEGRNLLHLALRNGGQDDVIDYLLLAYEEMIHDASSSNKTCLYYAAVRGDFKYISNFVELSLNPVCYISDKLSLLHLAVYKEDCNLLQNLIQAFPDMINQTDINGMNAIHFAAEKGNIECLRLLLGRGHASMSKTRSQSRLPLGWRQSVVQYPCQRFYELITQTDKDGWNAAHYAAYTDHLECLKFLLDAGIDPMARTTDERSTLLHVASLSGSAPVVEYLGQTFPGMVDMIDKNGRNSTDIAAYAGHLNCLQPVLYSSWNRTLRSSRQSQLTRQNWRHSVDSDAIQTEDNHESEAKCSIFCCLRRSIFTRR